MLAALSNGWTRNWAGRVSDMGLWTRILTRYLIGVIAGGLLWAGVPPDVIEMVRNDPEIVAAVSIALAALVERLTVIARRRGWLT